MLSTGMRLSDALNMTIGKYMEATSDYHDFIEVDDFIDNAPDDMQGFFDFEPQKTENNQEPTRCMTFNSPESNKFILQNLRRVKNEYLPNKFKNDPNKQKLKKSDALLDQKELFTKTHLYHRVYLQCMVVKIKNYKNGILTKSIKPSTMEKLALKIMISMLI